jgi:acyl-CoA synthetase (AMP-forming)/AMP-acid ligase II/ferredoxin
MLLEMVADGDPERVLVGPREGGLTASGLRQRSRRLAARLTAAGAAHVGLLDVNSVAAPITLFAAAEAGIPFAPLNYRLADDRLVSIAGRLAPGALVVGPESVPRVRSVEGLTLIPTGEAVDPPAPPRSAASPSEDPEAVAVMLFTSGTTGEPKAALLRHRHLASYIIGSVDFLGAGPDEAQLVSVPPYHIAGVSAILSCLFSGRRMVYLDAFDPQRWLETVSREGITQAMVVPTMLGRILDLVEEGGRPLGTLRHLSYGGGRMPVEVIERAAKLLPGVDLVNAYGLTETSSTVSVLTPEDHRVALASGDPAVRARLGSVGRPLPTVEVEIRDGHGRSIGPRRRGEIYVRGEQVAGEYAGGGVLTADGWFPTRDAGWLDDEGYLFLDGRLDDVIVRGAENLSPGEIEDAIMSHPAVVEVAVVGIADRQWGEAPAAAVVLAAGATVSAEDLQEWVRERLRSARTPTVIRFCDELPYNETGKLLRRVVRQQLAGEADGRPDEQRAPRPTPGNRPHREATTRIRIDEGLCAGHGRCYTLAPDLVQADDEGYPLQRGQDIELGAGMEAAGRRIVANCPEGAIRVV